MKVAVIGIGGVGSAALRFLARAGHDATGFEQFKLGHSRGSSHGESRIIRYAYPDLLYTQMMGDAYPLWDELEREAEEELFVRCGGLLFGPRGHQRVEGTAHSLAAAGVPYEMLEAGAVRERFPALRLRDNETALYQAYSGFLRSTRCIGANARLALAAGAEIHEESPVTSIRSHGNGKGVVVLTSDGEYHFDRVIVTAGAWMGKLLANLKMPLRVEQRQVVYLAIERNAEQFEPGRLPVWIDAGGAYYGIPSDGQVRGVKLASHPNGAPLDPDNPERKVIDEYVEQAVQYASERLPDLKSEVTHAQACLYTITPDEHFIIDQAPKMPEVTLISACSGHGFKFTVLLGKIAAGMATGEKYDRDLGRFRLERFAAPIQ